MARTLTRAIDHDKLRALSAEVDALVASGEWDHLHYTCILREAQEAVGGWTDHLEFVLSEAEPEWLEGDLVTIP
jgi:hypothetical protein